MRRKITIYIFTLLLLAVLAVTKLGRIAEKIIPFSVTVTSQSGTETIRCWEDGDIYHVFLPAYADLSQVRMQTRRLFPLYYQKNKVETGTSIESFPLDREIWFRFRSGFRRYEDVVVEFHRAENTACLYLDTSSSSMAYIHEKKGNEESGQLRLYTADGAQNCVAQIKSVRGRGNSSWDAPKKPYSLELMTREDLLGMGEAKKWILLANYFEASNICNKMGYEFAAALGDPYAPECEWVDLYLNGEYAGLYLLSERNEVDYQRVNIPEKGSFLLSLENYLRWDGKSFPGFRSERENFFRIQYAGMPMDHIEKIWQTAENAIYADDGIDPLTGKHWTELLDVESWARQWLLGEVLSENDLCAASQFLYYVEESGKLFAGPVWDLDNMLNFSGSQPANILTAQRRYIRNRTYETVFYRLYQQEEFRSQVQKLYWEEYRPLFQSLAEDGMDAYLAQCAASANMNHIRWSGARPEQAVEVMKDYLSERMAFLEDYWTSEADYCILEVKSEPQWRSYAVRRGESAVFLETYYWLDVHCWEDYETGEPFDIMSPMTEDRVIRYKYYEGA